MPYVMVPVPEEHVEEVMQFMLRALTKANLADWDEASVASLYAELDEFGRSLLAFVGRAGAAENDLPEGEVARLLQISPRETVAVVREIAEICREMERPAAVVRRSISEVQPNGRATEIPVLALDPEIVGLVNAVVDGDRTAADPLSRSE